MSLFKLKICHTFSSVPHVSKKYCKTWPEQKFLQISTAFSESGIYKSDFLLLKQLFAMRHFFWTKHVCTPKHQRFDHFIFSVCAGRCVQTGATCREWQREESLRSQAAHCFHANWWVKELIQRADPLVCNKSMGGYKHPAPYSFIEADIWGVTSM